MAKTRKVSKKEQRKKAMIALAFAVVVVILISAYLGTYLASILAAYAMSGSPVVLVHYIRDNGFPWLFFFLFVLASGSVALFAYLQHLKSQEGVQDVLGRRFWHPKDRQTYGDAHFEEPEEYEELAVVTDVKDEKCIGPILGQLSDDADEVISWRTENTRDNANIVAFGPSGSGKTFTFAKPYVYQCVKRRESIIVTDPDGGLYHDTRGLLQKNGYIVKTLNLKDFNLSHGWDCMKSVSFGNIEVNSQVFANTIIKNATEAKTDQIYRDGPMLLIKALVLRVMLGDDFPTEEKNIKTVYNILKRPDATDYIDSLFDETTMPPAAKVSRGPWDSFCLGGPNVKANIMMNLATNLQILQSDLVSRVLSTDEIDLNLPGHKPCAYFCQFPDSDSTFKFIVSLFFTMLFYTLTEQADTNHENGRKLDVPVNFLLDEFPSIGVLPDWDKKMATVRKRDIHVAMICQSITQLQNNYEDSWSSIVGNCATWLVLGVNDFVTAKQISERIGTATVQSQSEQHSANEPMVRLFGLKPHSSGEGKRNLLDPYELFELPVNDAIVLFQNHGPIYAHKFPHILHPSSKELGDIDGFGDLPPFDDRDARRARNEAEADYLSAWNKKHERELEEAKRKAETQSSKKDAKGKKRGLKKKKDQDEVEEEQVSFEEDHIEVVDFIEITDTTSEAEVVEDALPVQEPQKTEPEIPYEPNTRSVAFEKPSTPKRNTTSSLESELAAAKPKHGPPNRNMPRNYAATTSMSQMSAPTSKKKEQQQPPTRVTVDMEEVVKPASIKKQQASSAKEGDIRPSSLKGNALNAICSD